MGKILIEHDLFDIAARIRELDPDYFVLYDTESLRYELHHHKRKPTLELVFPYAKLDARAVSHTLMTRAERMEKLIREIDENNERLFLAEENKLRDRASCTAKSLVSYYSRHPDRVGEKIESI